jgi:hypothetical protein
MLDGLELVYTRRRNTYKSKSRDFTQITYTLSPKLNDTFFGLADYSGIDYGTDYNI